MFQKATKKQAKLRLAISGPSGSGKTMGALSLAQGLGGRIALLDTEHGSASLYSDKFDFDVMELAPPFAPERFIEAINGAAAAGYGVLVIDSITHEWDGAGGILDIHDKVTRAAKSGNSYTAWAEVTPRHNALLNAILRAPIHIISTLRSKTEYVLQDVGGKSVPRKLGMAPIQRAGYEYEQTVVLDLSLDNHLATATKDRTSLFDGATPEPISRTTGEKLLAWLNDGATVAQFDVDAALARFERCASLDELSATWTEIWPGVPLEHKQRIAAAKDESKAKFTTQGAAA
jgi:hypothetical protein